MSLLVACVTTVGKAAAQAPTSLSLDSLLNTPVSSVAKYRQNITEAAGSVTIITSDDIEAYGYRTLSDALNTVRGLYLTYDRNYTYVGARGFSRPTDYNNRILLLIDGNQTNEGVWGGAAIGPELGIDLQAVDRIEIVRGPSSALYGTGALFGIINVVTKATAGSHPTQVTAGAGSQGRRIASGSAGHTFAGGTRVFGFGFVDERDGRDLFFPEFDSPASNDGVAHALDWERSRGVLVGVTKGGLTVHGRYSSRRKGIPTGAYEIDFNDPRARTQDDYGLLEARYERGLSPFVRLTTRAYYNRYAYEGDYPSGADPGEEAGRNDVVGGEGLVHWDLRSSNRLTVGLEVRRHLTARYFGPRNGAPAFDLSVPYSVFSGYVEDELQLLPRLTLIGGLRHDHYSTTGAATTPRAGAVLDAGRGATVKLLYGEGFRAPNIYEALNETDGYQRNPSLRPERLRSWELIWQQRWPGGLLATVSLYDMQVRGLIDLSIDSESGNYTYRNHSRAHSYGAEIGLDARLGRRVRGYASYSLQSAHDPMLDEPLTNAPNHQVRLGATGGLTGWLQPAVETRFESGRLTVYGTRTESFVVTDLNLRIVPRQVPWLRQLDASVRLSNLFDVAYATPGGVEHAQPAIRQDGRTVLVRLAHVF